MKLQDPFDTAILGLNNVYHTIGDRSHYVNADNIKTPKKIITRNKQYKLVSKEPNESYFNVHQVKFLDGYYRRGYFYLFVLDIFSERVFIIDLCIECSEQDFTWELYDLEDYNKTSEADVIKSFCNKCNETGKTSDTKSKPKHEHDDLLEFDF
jgi:hypothetical protein